MANVSGEFPPFREDHDKANNMALDDGSDIQRFLEKEFPLMSTEERQALVTELASTRSAALAGVKRDLTTEYHTERVISRLPVTVYVGAMSNEQGEINE